MANNQEIYITNFWYAVNYGANLTAYALYSLVSEINNNTYILDNLNIRSRALLNRFYVKRFTKKYFSLKKYIRDENPKILLTGSDQVFNPNSEPDYNDSKFLRFAGLKDKKIAVSASFGSNKEDFLKENSIDKIEYVKDSLKSFDYVSVREKSGVEICRDIFGIEAEWIIDPVFIFDPTEWENLTQKSNINTKGKIVSYVFEKTKEHKKALKFLENKYNTSTIELDDYKKNPEDWLAAIKKCELFITNSFHGVCFAIIFNKPFICLSKETGKSTRFESLFEMLGVNDNSVSLKQIYEKNCIFNIDYDFINEKIKIERRRGLDFINRAINTEEKLTEIKVYEKNKVLETRMMELERQNNLPYQIKKSLWEHWLVFYLCYLPKSIKNIIRFVWHKNKA